MRRNYVGSMSEDEAIDVVFNSMIAVERAAKELARIDRAIFRRGFWRNLFTAVDIDGGQRAASALLADIAGTINGMADDNPMLLLAEMCGCAVVGMKVVIDGLKEHADGLPGPSYAEYTYSMDRYERSLKAFIAAWNDRS